jgi:5-methyltetrahydrofolate--homocysteine methyltransferase
MMRLQNLTIIGERINPGFASSKALLDACDIQGIQALAISQVEKGARYLTINIGERAEKDSAFLIDVIRAVQNVVDVPLSFDYPNRSVQENCLRTFDSGKTHGRRPIVNSITELRWEMLEVLQVQPARLVLMASERLENGVAIANETPEEIAFTAKRMVKKILAEFPSITMDDLIVDVSLCPIASDTGGQIGRAIGAIRLLGGDRELRGLHLMVGLSNIGVMLPKFALDGSRLSTKISKPRAKRCSPLAGGILPAIWPWALL